MNPPAFTFHNLKEVRILKFFVNAGNLLAVLLLGFLVSMLFTTSAFADVQDERFRINSGELGIPVIEGDSKSFSINTGVPTSIEYLNFTGQAGIFPQNFFHIDKYIALSPTGPLNQRRRMLTIAFT